MDQIWVAAVDPELTPGGLISPGLGDTVSGLSTGPVTSDVVDTGRQAVQHIVV